MKIYINNQVAHFNYPMGTFLEEGVRGIDSDGNEALIDRVVLPNGWMELEVEEGEMPERPRFTLDELKTKSMRLVYKDNALSYEVYLDKNKVKRLIEEKKEAMNAKAYKTEKHIQGALSAEEWETHKTWCAEIRSEINDLENLLRTA